MYKVVLLLTRRDDIPAAGFTAPWLQAQRAAPALPGLQGHVHNRALGRDMPIENAPPASYDGADEYWFADAAAAAETLASPAWREHWTRACEPLLGSAAQVLSGTPSVVWQREAVATDAVKIITLPVRRAGMTMEAFAHHWIHVHSGLALQGEHTRARLLRLEPCPTDGQHFAGLAAAPFDGAGTIEFASRADLQAEFAGAHYREVMAPDEPRFTDPARSSALMVEPHRLR